MVSAHVRDAFIERPEFLLALMLSTPADKPEQHTSVTVEFRNDEVVAKVPVPSGFRRAPQLLATKETIFAAILLHHLLTERGPEFGALLTERARRFSENAASRNADYQHDVSSGWYPAAQRSGVDTASFFFQELEIGPDELRAAQSKTQDALEFLEAEGLAIDPAFTTGLMILAGLLPMHFSVRTPKGERVYWEFRVNAPMWSLDISRGTSKGRPYTDAEFRFRGIEIVKKAITAMATQYLETEENIRKGQRRPVLPRDGSPNLD